MYCGTVIHLNLCSLSSFVMLSHDQTLWPSPKLVNYFINHHGCLVFHRSSAILLFFNMLIFFRSWAVHITLRQLLNIEGPEGSQQKPQMSLLLTLLVHGVLTKLGDAAGGSASPQGVKITCEQRLLYTKDLEHGHFCWRQFEWPEQHLKNWMECSNIIVEVSHYSPQNVWHFLVKLPISNLRRHPLGFRGGTNHFEACNLAVCNNRRAGVLQRLPEVSKLCQSIMFKGRYTIILYMTTTI